MGTWKITTRIWGILALSILVGASGGGFLYMRLQSVASSYERLFDHNVQDQDLSRVLQLNFKKQVQEWKDLLLRGRGPAGLPEVQARLFKTQRARSDDGAGAVEATSTIRAPQADSGDSPRRTRQMGKSRCSDRGVRGLEGHRTAAPPTRWSRGMDRRADRRRSTRVVGCAVLANVRESQKPAIIEHPVHVRRGRRVSALVMRSSRSSVVIAPPHPAEMVRPLGTEPDARRSWRRGGAVRSRRRRSRCRRARPSRRRRSRRRRRRWKKWRR